MSQQYTLRLDLGSTCQKEGCQHMRFPVICGPSMFPSTPSWEALESVDPGPGFLPAFGCSVGGCGRHGCPWLEAQDAWGPLPSTQFSQGVGPCLYRGNVGLA